MRLPTFETERLILRQMEATDAEGLHAAYSDPQAMRFWDFPPTHDLNETAAHIRAALRPGSLRQAVWAIVLRGEGFVGMINYHHREPQNRRLELGWVLAPAFWRRGLMSEAAQTLLHHCFTRLKVHRVEAIIEPENTASRALAAKLGFVQEGGLLCDRLCVAGEFRSVLMHALLQADWWRMTAGGKV
jgi:ribosomal-protein-alanine N-acetyltransferase